MLCFLFFFFNDTATTEIYTLSLHDALPIYVRAVAAGLPRSSEVLVRDRVKFRVGRIVYLAFSRDEAVMGDRKSTRLNSSHANISYAVFCLKKKKKHDRAHQGRGLSHARAR